ncbi:phosphoglycerate mutase-like protein [Selaginella moellendorffii]|uniref:phosphoglycerate mutase-like protein n=1 Tax=Selaginella moellendorffii TaxID=88036 RepID=UPI000D1CBC18|nr:phosphoglycerate mutase-like protein [Selaginella moellendorffii]|eukprot:XP_024532652.1 phosphoglycerate mutase-like protein [Selaginella moellendorffii]
MEQGPTLLPLQHCKIIHLVRHAQGYHNVAGEVDIASYNDYALLDASLTPNGWNQVARLRKHVVDTGLGNGIELVVVSPLTRTLQTAVGVFGGGEFVDGEIAPPLMVNGVGKSPHPAVSSARCPPFLALELCREHTGVHPCDKRNPISRYKLEFPGVDFSEIETDEDEWWNADIREPDEDLCQRGLEFLKWLLRRDEKEIAVVSHSGFLTHMVTLFGDDCGDTVQQEIRSRFANCALRTVILTDKNGFTKKPSQSINFPGGVPPGPSSGSHLKDKIERSLSQKN